MVLSHPLPMQWFLTVPIFIFHHEKLADNAFEFFNVLKVPSPQNMSYGSEQMVIRKFKVWNVNFVWKQFYSIQFLGSFSLVVWSVYGIALSCCNNTLLQFIQTASFTQNNRKVFKLFRIQLSNDSFSIWKSLKCVTLYPFIILPRHTLFSYKSALLNNGFS